MSITITTDIFCDVCKIEWIHGCTGGSARAKYARAAIKSSGWVRRTWGSCPKVLDVCPKCHAKGPDA